MRWLEGATPSLDEARGAVDWIIKESHRAGEVIRRVRALANKTDLEKVPLDINDVVNEVVVTGAARNGQPTGVAANRVGTRSAPDPG